MKDLMFLSWDLIAIWASEKVTALQKPILYHTTRLYLSYKIKVLTIPIDMLSFIIVWIHKSLESFIELTTIINI